MAPVLFGPYQGGQLQIRVSVPAQPPWLQVMAIVMLPQASCSADSEQLSNLSLGCDGQTPFWTMFMCNVDRNNWQQLMCMVTCKGWCKLQQIRATHDLHYSSLLVLEINSGTHLNAVIFKYVATNSLLPNSSWSLLNATSWSLRLSDPETSGL